MRSRVWATIRTAITRKTLREAFAPAVLGEGFLRDDLFVAVHEHGAVFFRASHGCCGIARPAFGLSNHVPHALPNADDAWRQHAVDVLQLTPDPRVLLQELGTPSGRSAVVIAVRILRPCHAPAYDGAGAPCSACGAMAGLSAFHRQPMQRARPQLPADAVPPPRRFGSSSEVAAQGDA